MNCEGKNALYLHFTNGLRNIEERSYNGWAGSEIAPENRCTRYPNLVAEIANNGPDISTIAMDANMTPRLLCAVIEAGEVLTPVEMSALYRRYFQFSKKARKTPISYLCSPTLSVVEGNTNKGKYRLRTLQDGLSRLKDLLSRNTYDPMTEIWLSGFRDEDEWRLWQTRLAIEKLSAGESISFALYRHAEETIADAMSLIIRAETNRHNRPRDISA